MLVPAVSFSSEQVNENQNQNLAEPAHPYPPKEALEACNSKAEGATCSFMGRNDRTVSGTCHKGPRGKGPLACKPENNASMPQ